MSPQPLSPLPPANEYFDFCPIFVRPEHSFYVPSPPSPHLFIIGDSFQPEFETEWPVCSVFCFVSYYKEANFLLIIDFTLQK